MTNTSDMFEVSAENIGVIRLADNVGDPLSDPIKMIFLCNAGVVETNGSRLKIHDAYVTILELFMFCLIY